MLDMPLPLLVIAAAKDVTVDVLPSLVITVVKVLETSNSGKGVVTAVPNSAVSRAPLVCQSIHQDDKSAPSNEGC
jgi:hypothetical protein